MQIPILAIGLHQIVEEPLRRTVFLADHLVGQLEHTVRRPLHIHQQDTVGLARAGQAARAAGIDRHVRRARGRALNGQKGFGAMRSLCSEQIW